MSTGRLLCIFSATAALYHLKPDGSSSSKEFGWLKTFSLYLQNEEKYRARGITPSVLHESAKAAFASRHRHKALCQYNRMKKMHPMEGEAPLYEESGNELFKNDFPNHAVTHWKIAYEHGHKPDPMCTDLGNWSMKIGELNYALNVFLYQLTLQPGDLNKQNNVGIANFMLATQHQIQGFCFYKRAALEAFNKGKSHHQTINENYETAERLHFGPDYGLAFLRLQFTPGTFTEMNGPLRDSLERNEFKQETRSEVIWTYVPNPNGQGGRTVPSYYNNTYYVQNPGNTAALKVLRELKEKFAKDESGVEQAPRPRI